MPGPILIQPQSQSRTENILSAMPTKEQKQKTQQMDRMMRDRLLRKTRSKAYMQAMHRLDAGGRVHNQQKVNEIIEAIRVELPEIEIGGDFKGIISTCYLGEPYEVHTLDLVQNIIEHYVTGEPLPNGLEKARAIALHGNYDYIEVYTDRAIAVSANGRASIILL